jgi:DNA-binding NarL/FixJ family response regulator
VQSGGTYVPARMLDPAAGPPHDLKSADLTPRQLDVLQCLLRGEPNKQIARQLGLTEGTVKIHIAAILRALHARNRTEAVVRARSLGIDRQA